MYPLVLILHSWMRWVAIAAGVAAMGASVAGRPSGDALARSDRWGLIFTIALDVQFLLGLLLYFFVSPNMQAILGDFAASMRDPVARFWAVEHLSLMLFAVAIAHVGRVLARKASTPAQARTRRLVCFGLATVAMIAATPWPGRASGRPLFRL